MDEQAQHAIRLIRHCHSGGAFGSFWNGNTKRSQWYEVGKPASMPTAPNTYFGVHPSTAIPDTNMDGKPTPPEYVRTQIAHIAAVNCLFAEFDAKDMGGKDATLEHVRNLHVSPSVVIDSGGGFHCYWLFELPVIISTDATRQLLITAQADWVEWLNGDRGAKDLARVLRVPGTFNAKYNPPRRVEAVGELTDWALYEFSFLHDLCAQELSTIRKANALASVGVIEKARSAPAHTDDSLIDEYNRTTTPQELLRRNGYTLNASDSRFTRPGKKASDGISGTIAETHGKQTIYTFSTSDGLFEESPDGKRHRMDAYDLLVRLEHHGDHKAAFRAVAQQLGRTSQRHTPVEPIDHERAIANILKPA